MLADGPQIFKEAFELGGRVTTMDVILNFSRYNIVFGNILVGRYSYSTSGRISRKNHYVHPLK